MRKGDGPLTLSWRASGTGTTDATANGDPEEVTRMYIGGGVIVLILLILLLLWMF